MSETWHEEMYDDADDGTWPIADELTYSYWSADELTYSYWTRDGLYWEQDPDLD